MKTIYLIRHAKSGWDIADLPDIDRPLNERGYNDAHRMSLRLKEKKIQPDLIISSPAIRALSTALIFCRSLNYDPSQVLLEKDLYNTNEKEYLKALRSIDNKHKVIFLFGHNPLITNCVNALVHSFTEEMSTCSIAGIKADIKEWKLLKRNVNELISYDYPKNNE